MRRNTSRGLVVVMALALAGLTIPAPNAGELGRFEWLAGTWKRERADKTVYETWRALSDRTMEGESYVVTKKTGDKVLTESLLLVEMGPDVYYIPRPMGNDYPVAFRLVKSDDGQAVFENKQHDFPQRITYVHNADGSLAVTIEGPGPDGAPHSIVFEFQRG